MKSSLQWQHRRLKLFETSKVEKPQEPIKDLPEKNKVFLLSLRSISPSAIELRNERAPPREADRA